MITFFLEKKTESSMEFCDCSVTSYVLERAQYPSPILIPDIPLVKSQNKKLFGNTNLH